MAPTGRLGLLLAGLAVLLASACSSGGADAPDASAGAPASPVPSATRSTPAPSSVGPTPTPGPATIPKVSRPDHKGKPTITAKRQNFDAPVAYPDGLSLAVEAVESGVESGHGAGVFAGREFTVFALTLRNGTSKSLDLQQVVVTATYGSEDLVAERVYADDVEAIDFGGDLAAGKDAEARYAFAVPKAALGDVRLVVDFDGAHTSAVFSGDALEAG